MAAVEPADGFWYQVKCRALGSPLVTEQLSSQRLSRPLALGVLSCDGLSSAAYGTEEILYALLPFFGLAAFTLVLPLTLVVLFGVLLVVLSYREVVSVYTRAGGSYVVARENFGPRVAQVAAVALLIDYVVTVAVQTAAGSAAIVSAFPALSRIPVIGPKILLVISVVAICVMCLGNLRGIREAGRVFAAPTYLFAGSVIVMIITGLVRELTGTLGHAVPGPGAVGIGSHSGLIAFGAIYIMAKAFANGGSSLTGIEAVSNAVSALRPPEGRHARQILTAQGAIVAFLIAGISWLAHATHAIPYTAGFPTVLAQEAGLVFGHTAAGQVAFYALQAATAAILFTGGNTSFTGFPYLASFVADDSFLPRWLTRRGHRLVFSNGIILLAALSLTLMLVAGATVDALIPFYAIGVFTGFAMAGFGMAKYHRRTREPGWRRRLVINTAGGIYTALVVVLFAVVKFTEGAWLIVIIFPILVFMLIRLNREYRAEAAILAEPSHGGVQLKPPNHARRVVLLLIDNYDLATVAALKYAKGLRPTTLRAVHFSLDAERAGRLKAAVGGRGQRSAAGTSGLPRPAASPRDGPAGGRAGGGAGHARDRRAAAPQLPAAGRTAAARPHRGPDSTRRQPHPWRGGHHRSLRRQSPGQDGASRRGRPGPGRQARPPRRLRVARTAAGHRPHRVAAAARPCDRPGPPARRGDPVRQGGREHRAGLRGRRLHRPAHRRLLWPRADHGRRAGHQDPAARHGRHRRRRSPGDDQPRLRTARVRTPGRRS